VDLSSGIQCALEVQLADIEYRLNNGGSEQLQLGALIAAFTYARHMVDTEARVKLLHT
jgi:hypothetical protein